MKTVFDFMTHKKEHKKISMVTCYDYTSAKIVERSTVNCILVGDSAAMVMHGHSSTLPISVETLALHVAAVAKGAPTKFLVADMPFLSFRKDLTTAMNAVEKLMQAGAHAVKLEGVEGHEGIVKHIVQSGVPVMGHLGLTPQSIHQLGGYRVQGKDSTDAQILLSHAHTLQDLGCFSVVLECVPATLAAQISQELSIPTIGIGAGVNVDGQVLVWQDLLGFNHGFKPRFLKTYLNGHDLVLDALNEFNEDVKDATFPTLEQSY